MARQNQVKTSSLIVQRVSRWMAPFIFLYGIYIVMYGHLSPGGGFPGGVILASAFILVLLAKGKQQALINLPYGLAKKLDAVGALAFLAVALVGLVVTGVFFENFIQRLWPGEPFTTFNAGTIIISNIAIGIKVCASLFLVMLFLSILRISSERQPRQIESMEDR